MPNVPERPLFQSFYVGLGTNRALESGSALRTFEIKQASSANDSNG